MSSEAALKSDFVTLYLDIPKGASVNIATLGRSLIEFEKMAREVAARTDPFIQFELGFERSEEGSLRLITKLKETISDFRLKQVAWAIIITMVIDPAINIVSDDTMREIMESMGYPQEQMSDADMKRFSKILKETLEDDEVKRSRNNLYQTLEADPDILGIGALPDSAPGRPFTVIPREHFSKMGIPDSSEATADPVPRVVTSTEMLILERPVLRRASKAVWEFRLNGQKISARVEDADFIDSALSGKLSIPLIEGVEMKVILEDSQEFNNGSWSHKSYTVRKVTGWSSPNEQPSLPLINSSKDKNN